MKTKFILKGIFIVSFAFVVSKEIFAEEQNAGNLTAGDHKTVTFIKDMENVYRMYGTLVDDWKVKSSRIVDNKPHWTDECGETKVAASASGFDKAKELPELFSTTVEAILTKEGTGDTIPKCSITGKSNFGFSIKSTKPEEKEDRIVVAWGTFTQFESFWDDEKSKHAPADWSIGDVQGKNLENVDTIAIAESGGNFNWDDFEPGEYTVKAIRGSKYDSMKIVMPKIKIIHPKNKIPEDNVIYDKDYFDTSSLPYCYEHQGVSKEAYGKTSQQQIKKIEGKITPNSLGFIWHLGEDAGTINPLEGNTTPTHSPPDTASIAGTQVILSLRLKDNEDIIARKNVIVYKDHLARDVVNFLNGKSCSPVELSDGSKLKGISMTCGPSMGHAHEGTLTDANQIWKKLLGEGWKEKVYKWKQFNKLKLGRNWKVWLGSKEGKFHPSTVKSAGSGSTAITYSGDAVSGEFRHETVKLYYDKVIAQMPSGPIDDNIRRVWVLKPKK